MQSTETADWETCAGRGGSDLTSLEGKRHCFARLMLCASLPWDHDALLHSHVVAVQSCGGVPCAPGGWSLGWWPPYVHLGGGHWGGGHPMCSWGVVTGVMATPCAPEGWSLITILEADTLITSIAGEKGISYVERLQNKATSRRRSWRRILLSTAVMHEAWSSSLRV